MQSIKIWSVSARFFWLLLAVMAFGSLKAQTTTTFTASGNFTVPCGVTSIQVQAWGGGGGGAGDGNTSSASGAAGGGGAGGYSSSTIAVVPGTVINFTIGAAGAGGSGAVNGGNGGATTFATVSANGGAGGRIEGGGGGAGGAGSTANGGSGANGAGTTGGNGGSAGGPGGGTGGNGATLGNNGSPGGVPGGGGGGAGNRSGGAEDGGAGARGQIIITYTGAAAGPDQTLAACATTTTLNATAPAAGSGTWTCVANCGSVVITNPALRNTAVSGIPAGGSATFRWTVAAGGCTASSDDVVINSPIGAACAVFLHGTAGIQGERVTHCLQNICGGDYYDDGGAAGNYSNSVLGGLYRVFCPNTVGNCMRVTFNSFATEGTANTTCSFDYLTVGNGATQNSPVMLRTGTNNNTAGRICGNPATPFSFTADNPSGCLSFRFTSDGSVQGAGWSASLSCVPCATAGNGPDLDENNDCIRATPLCAGTAINNNAVGPGLVGEGCTGNACPAGGENHSNWYSFQISTAGTLTFDITPITATDDYDYTLYGPNASCAFLGSPLRCSDSGDAGVTGLTAASADFTESVSGDKFTRQINVQVGETYLLMVDEWSANTGGGYSLAFGGTASLDCIVLLPVKFSLVEAIYEAQSKKARINWNTEKEIHLDYYEVEKSYDGVHFSFLERVPVFNNSYTAREYSTYDPNPSREGTTYYRIKYGSQTMDAQYSEIVAVQVYDPEFDAPISLSPNPFKNSIEMRYHAEQMGQATVRIIDLSGKTAEVLHLGAVEGSNSAELQLAHLQAGFYVLHLEINGKHYQRKIVKY